MQNEKYKGCARPRKSDTADFLSKKQVEDRGEVPRYYVPDDHEVIVAPEGFERVQDMIRQCNARSCDRTRCKMAHLTEQIQA